MPLTIDEIIIKAQLNYTAQQIPARPDGLNDTWHKTAKHYLCTIRREGFGPRGPLVICYSMGSGHKHGPRLRDVLNSLAADADVLNYSEFETWAADLGYDADSRRAEAIYDKCREQSQALRKLLDEELFRQLIAAERL